MYFRTSDCRPDIERCIRIHSSGGAVVLGSQGVGLGAPASDLTAQQVSDTAHELLLKYSQLYVKDTCRNRTIFPSKPSHGVSDRAPKHVARKLCLCQYIEKEHFNRPLKPWYERILV